MSVDSVDLSRFFQCVVEEELRRLTHEIYGLTSVQVMSLLNVDKFVVDFENEYSNRAPTAQEDAGNSSTRKKHHVRTMLKVLNRSCCIGRQLVHLVCQ